METEDEKTQRLVKEGIEKAKEDELIQRLSDKTSGKCFDSGKKTYPNDIPPTSGRIIGAPSKTWLTGEEPPTDEITKTSYPFVNLILIAVGLTITIVILGSPNILGAIGELLLMDGSGQNVQSRAEIFSEAKVLSQDCNDSIENNNVFAPIICQKELNYLYSHREVLDSGTIKNWASDTITRLENNISIKPTSGSSNTGANSGVTGYQEQDTNDVRGNVAYSLWQNSIPYTYYERNDYGEPAMENTGKLFMIIQYDRISQEVIDYDLGLSETTQKAIDTPSNSPVIPTPLLPSEGYDDSFVKGLQKHGKPVFLNGGIILFESWNPDGNDTRGHEIVNTVGGFTSTKTYEVYGKYDENGNKIWRETTVWRFTIGDKLMAGRLVEGGKDNDITNPIQLTKLYECDDGYCSRLLFS